jgi:hypothetical protein
MSNPHLQNSHHGSTFERLLAYSILLFMAVVLAAYAVRSLVPE